MADPSARVRDLLLTVGPPNGVLLQDELDTVLRYTSQLASADFTTLGALQEGTFDDFKAITTPGAARLLKKAFAGAGTSAGAGAAAGKIPTAEVLRCRLPSLPWGSTDSKSTAGGLHYYVPSDVLSLDKGPLSDDFWTQEVIRTMQAADAHDHWAFPLPDVIPTTAISEAGIAGQMVAPLQLLTTALNKASALQPRQRPQTQGWVAETTTSLLQKAAGGYIGKHPDLSEFQTPALASHGSSNGSELRQDVVLITSGQHLAQQSQQQQQQQVQQQQQQHNQQQQLASIQSQLFSGTPVAVGEYKKPTALATHVQGTFHPLDLKEFRDLKDVKDPFVQHAVCQVYTYLLLLQLQYAFLSCYYWTWVVHLGKDRRTLYISDPIAHDTISNQDSPKVTTLGAIYWVQHCGLQTFEDKDFDDIDFDSLRRVKDLREVLPVSQEPASQPDNPDNDPPYDPKQDGSSKNSRRDNRGGGRGRGGNSGSGTKSRGSKGSGSSGRTSGSSGRAGGGKVSKRHHESLGASDGNGRLQLGRLICEGCSGLVMHGTFQGQPAVYKFFGPDTEGVAAGTNEVRIYRALERCQGEHVPIFLGCGHLLAGISFLATAYVEGVPCSELPIELQAAAASAAGTALQAICVEQPGFLHGDLRLPNIMIRQGSNDTEAPTAVIIDLAASRLDGTPEEAKMQFRQLKSLFRR